MKGKLWVPECKSSKTHTHTLIAVCFSTSNLRNKWCRRRLLLTGYPRVSSSQSTARPLLAVSAKVHLYAKLLKNPTEPHSQQVCSKIFCDNAQKTLCCAVLQWQSIHKRHVTIFGGNPYTTWTCFVNSLTLQIYTPRFGSFPWSYIYIHTLVCLRLNLIKKHTSQISFPRWSKTCRIAPAIDCCFPKSFVEEEGPACAEYQGNCKV